ncbi:MAG TPA: hypothetical protein VJ760_06775 [Nitrospiraceae bacterium]|nr:hypothetical protein [Nitrospiraceae bacterium]
MTYEPTNIISRIAWCRLQQRLHSITKDEHAGWRAEETGLMDALDCRDRTTFMREEHQAQFIRYQCGLEDGRALLRLSNAASRGMTHMHMEESGLTPPTTSAWMDKRSLQAPLPMHEKESRR